MIMKKRRKPSKTRLKKPKIKRACGSMFYSPGALESNRCVLAALDHSLGGTLKCVYWDYGICELKSKHKVNVEERV